MEQQGWIPYSNQLEQDADGMRRGLRKTGGRCFLLVFCLALAAQVFSFLLIFVLFGIQTLTRQGISMSQEMLGFVSSMLPCILADIGMIILGCGILKISFRRDVCSKPKTGWDFTCIGVLAVLGAGTLGGIVYMIYGSILEVMGISLPQPSFSLTPSDVPALILSTLYICVLGPVMEELIFRGFILKNLQKFGNISAILLSALLFSLFHQNLVQLVPAFITGLVLGFLTVKSGSLVPAILAHIVNNVVRILPELLPGGAETDSLVLWVYSILIFVLSIAGICVFLVHYKKEFWAMSHVENANGMRIKKKVGAVLSTPWAIIFFCLYALLIALGFVSQWLSGLSL